jgi:Sulfatase
MSLTRSGNPWFRRVRLASALPLLNASLTFENVWPTPLIKWAGGVSIELALVLLALASAGRLMRPRSRRMIGALSGIWIALVAGRYVEVTAPALYGRDLNLYWDLRFIPDVAAMVIRVATGWLVACVAVLVAVIVLLLHRAFAWALNGVVDALEYRTDRRVLAAVASVLIVLFVGERLGGRVPLRFTPPVTRTYAHQIALILEARDGSRALPPTPDMTSPFTQVDDGDVILVFVESYGAVSYRPDISARLAASRETLGRQIGATHRAVVSAFVESPTFGGSSWLAHVSLVSGVEVRDPDTNARLMTQSRDTLVRAFGRHGFRTIALMPGLRQRWPEGSFYGFDAIYGANQLSYTGPEFGWFAIPDQFSLAKLDALENDGPSTRRFIFFPTISTHFPFSPTPPYQSDWTRMFAARPYDGPDIVRAYARQPDWTNFTPGYIDALAYDFAVLGGYLTRWPDRKLVMILVGDHQPPAAVSGERATWTVPVHVIAGPGALLDRLKRRGFTDGLTPSGTPVARMHALLPILLDAFGGNDD